MKWKLNLPNSKTFRESVEEENSMRVYEEIIKGYEWMSKVFNEDMTIEIQNVSDDLECEAFDEDSVNVHLDDFYYQCDARKVWIEL